MITIECPCCEEENEFETSDILCLMDSDDIANDIDCEHCGKKLDIHIEFEPTGWAEEVIYTNCNCCKGTFKKRFLHKRGSTFPFPKNPQYNQLCPLCHSREYFKEQEKNANDGYGIKNLD